MPLTVIATKGVFTPDNEKKIIPELSALMLRLHGLEGNKFMTPVVIGHLELVEPDLIFSGGAPVVSVFIEWKVPSLAFSNQQILNDYVREATDIAVTLSKGNLSKKNVFVNVVHAVNGSWGIQGKAYSNAELSSAIGENVAY
jgi:hypothetical protein